MTIPSSGRIKNIVLDFDGTCTQIPAIYEKYLERFYEGFAKHVEQLRENAKVSGGALTAEEWRDAQAAVRRHSPTAGWTLGGSPAAPAAADPYILADESAKLVLRRRGVKNPSLPHTINGDAYASTPAPWRPEALETFRRLVDAGVAIYIVSNSSTTFIQGRLDELLADEPDLRKAVTVHSDAGKFSVRELAWDDESISAEAKAKFSALPVATNSELEGEPGRPIYLRRGAYFEALVRVLDGKPEQLERTVVCGDIWEMDLAMPFALGANVHLLERAAPFSTYSYENDAVAACQYRGLKSSDLSGLLVWLLVPDHPAILSSTCQEPTAQRLDRLKFYYAEHAEQARQHENQRERTTNLVLVVTGALISVITFANLAIWSLPAALTMMAFGVYGLIFARKHYERNRYHVSIMREVRNEMEYVSGTMRRPADVSLNRTLEQLREDGVAAHFSKYSKSGDKRKTETSATARKDDKEFLKSDARFIARVRLHELWEGFHWLIIGLGIFFCVVVLSKWFLPFNN